MRVKDARTRCIRASPRWGLNGAEEAVLLVVHAGGEEQGIRGTGLMTVAKGQGPQRGDRDRAAMIVGEWAKEGAAPRVEGVDAAITGVADKQSTAEGTEISRRQRKPPR